MSIQDDEKKLNILFKRIVDFLVEKQLYACCIPASVIFLECAKGLGIRGQIVSGFGLSNEFAFWHCWVQINNKNYDLAYEIIHQLFPEHYLQIPKPLLSITMPIGHTRIDMDNDEECEILKQNNEVFEIYQKHGDVAFWNEIKIRGDPQTFDIFQELLNKLS